MSLIYTNNNTEVEFDNYCLYNGETDEYSENGENFDGYEIADVYVCPHCIKKYGLYSECDTTESATDASIEYHTENGYSSDTPVCFVKGCYNTESFDGTLNLSLCRINASYERIRERAIWAER